MKVMGSNLKELTKMGMKFCEETAEILYKEGVVRFVTTETPYRVQRPDHFYCTMFSWQWTSSPSWEMVVT